jgi:glycosyltransferase involved in cell wall biosynthesis
MPRLAFATNEPRSRFLLAELMRLADVVTEIDFDQIDPLTKYSAALLSYRRPRSEWWDAYQMHPLVQSRRRKVLARALRGPIATVDALLMWGSWFHPFRDRSSTAVPYFNYIDQSHSLIPSFGEPAASPRGRVRAHQLQAETYRDSGGILCMSQWARAQTLAAHEVPSHKVHVVGWGPCGVDLSAEQITETAREPLVLHVSNSFHRKGVDFLLETARLVAAVVPAARFVVVGKDAENMVVRNTENVTFVGAVTDRLALADYFRRASVFFMPHRFDRSPHAVVEAMSAGLPVVTSAQGGSIELVDGSRAGHCLPIGDVAGYAEAIIGLLKDPDARQRAGANGRGAVRQTYNWRTVAQRILRLMTGDTYRDGAAQRSGAGARA